MLMLKKYITYYGEYSLKNWVKMVLNQEVTLPEYQRYFVWDATMAILLLKNLSEGIFVPPVVLASYSGDKDNKATVYVLDGQQRLSSILLFYLEYWPVNFKKNDSDFVNEDSTNDAGDVIEDNDRRTFAQAQNWSFKKIQGIYQQEGSIESLKEKLRNDTNYQKIDDYLLFLGCDDSVLKAYKSIMKCNRDRLFGDNFFGFSFIKSVKADSNDEKKLFSEIFRSINISSIPLTAEESRAALYWLKPECKGFLMPEFASDIKVNRNKFDWVRCLSYVSEANKIGGNFRVAVGYGNRKNPYEKYIELFVRTVVSNDDVDDQFTKYHPDFLKRVKMVKDFYEKYINEKSFSSLIDADYYFFGLIFWVIFQDKQLNLSNQRAQEFNKIMKEKIAYIKKDQEYFKSSGRITRIRDRLKDSIELYKTFLE